MAKNFLMTAQSNPIKGSVESMANKALVELAVPQGKNFVMSTLSCKAILAIVALGSTGNTRQQLLGFLGLNAIENLRSLAKRIMNVTRTPVQGTAFRFPSQAEALEISFANAVWLHEDYRFTRSFEAIVKYLFNAESRALTKGEKGCVITKPINSWAADVTKGLIKEILPQELPGETRLVLTNAIYFKGKWIDKFEKSYSRYRNFYLLNKQIIQAPFMTSTEMNRLYGDFSSFQVLGLPYQCDQDERRFQLYIFLPEKKDGLLSLIQMLNSNPGGNFNLHEVELAQLWIPKFKFSYQFEGSNILQDLGLTLPFKADNKDFTGMVISHKGVAETMYVSNFIHEASIEVDEEGTEAAAVTVCGCGSCGPTDRSAPSFIADHPFYFLLREETTKTVFFSGAVLNPLVDS